MKTQSSEPQPTERSTGGVQSIIYGGGWKSPPTEERLQIKAFASVFLTILAAATGVHFYQDYGPLVFVPSLALFITTVLLFCFERPTTLWGPQDGKYDIRNLHGCSHDILKTKTKGEHDDSK